MVQSGDTLVLSLAELLGGKQVDTGVIDRALAELCSAFDFDGGLIYELDQYNHLHLKERCLLRNCLCGAAFRSTRSTLLTAAIWLRKPLSGWRVDKRTVRLRMLCWSCLRRSRW